MDEILKQIKKYVEDNLFYKMKYTDYQKFIKFLDSLKNSEKI